MRQWTRPKAFAVAVTALATVATGCSAVSSSGGSAATTTSLTSALPTSFGPAEKKTLNVGVVPAMDSAGFFVALHDGLFAKEGLTIDYTPATSSETAVKQQLQGQLDISAGNYVSYIEEAALNKAPIEVVAEGSVMQAGAQTIFVGPKSKIKTLDGLKGATVATNAPRNVDYLLAASVLQENGIKPASVHWSTQPIAFPLVAGDLSAGKFDAAVLPEPFASIAEQQYGEIPLADLNQGASEQFPIEGYVVTKQWASENPNTLKRFLAALEVGQEISDSQRGAVESAFETLKAPQDGLVPKEIGAVMALDTYPIGVDAVRLQRVADVMEQFGLLPRQYDVSGMLLPPKFFNFGQFSSSAS
jgi:NitT/TauT family transport system substrate-binding protein